MKAETMAAPTVDMLHRLDRLMTEMVAVREELSHLETARPVSARVVEWAQKVNAAINDPAMSPEKRTEVVDSVPAPLRHAVAAECYRTNENVTFGWAATIAGVLTLEAPDLLRSQGVEPEFTTNMGMTVEEIDEEIAALASRGVLER